jgi:hypothetical protein
MTENNNDRGIEGLIQVQRPTELIAEFENKFAKDWFF